MHKTEHSEKCKELLAGLRAEQKLRLLCGKGAWNTEDFDGALPRASMSDGPVGLRTVRKGEDGKEQTIPAVGYPSVQVLANTWSVSCAEKMGEALADDCRERGVNLLLAPGMNIKRHPLNGRNFEYFSEDPYLAGTMAKAYVSGLQNKGVGACIKHFCCNNLEYDRLHQSSEVDERALREIYYRPFAIACEAKPVSLMCSYNRINGTYGSEYKKGFSVLREECGFDGAVISDWGAVRDRTAAAIAGLDLEMPFSEQNYRKLAEDYREGKISDEELDACAANVIELVLRLEQMGRGRKIELSEAERAAAARHIAEEGIVLLKNEGVLPLQNKTTAAVCGLCAKPHDAHVLLAGGGSSCVDWKENAFDLPAALSACGIDVRYEPAFAVDTVWSFIQDTRMAVENAAACDVNIVCVGAGGFAEFEESDRKSMRLPEVQERTILDTAAENPNTIVIVFAGAAVDMRAWEDRVKAIVYAGFPGMGSDKALADVLTGRVNPSGKLTETFPLAFEDCPAAQAVPQAGVTRYWEGIDVGYRYFDAYNVPVMFPFGYGLSYSSFEYSDLRLRVDGDAVFVDYTIENASAYDGKEVSQVYVRACAPKVYRPGKELKGFDKREIGVGAAASVCVRLDRQAFAYWSVSQDRWVVDDGIYEILVAASVCDVRLRAKVQVREGRLAVL